MMSVTEPVRRFEVFEGAGRRRRWSAAQKAQIVEESFGAADSVCAVARRHGLSSTQLFAWRKAAREQAMTAFVPVCVEPAMTPAPAAPSEPHKARRGGRGGIELEIDGVVVRVDRGAESKTVSAVIRALKAGSVIAPPSGVRVLVATKLVDFRKGAGGLAALVKEEMGADPFSGVIYVFRAKRADKIKLLYWDGTDVVLVAKTLEQGGFRWPRIQDGAMRLSGVQLGALLDGLDWARVYRAGRTRAPIAAN